MSRHNFSEAVQLGSRLIVMSPGRIEQIGGRNKSCVTRLMNMWPPFCKRKRSAVLSGSAGMRIKGGQISDMKIRASS
jgi:ABC-type uncharacterized transport system ATPase component